MINIQRILLGCIGVAGLVEITAISATYASIQPAIPSAIQEETVSEFDRQLSRPIAQTNGIAEIIDVQIDPTETGLSILLKTPSGSLTLPTPTVDNNSQVLDIPNARLALPGGALVQSENLPPGLDRISITQSENQQVRVLIVGTEALPMIESRLQGDDVVLDISTTAAIANDGLRIVVTAEKTPEDLLDVPISLTVLTEKELVDAQINSIAEVAANTPNFYFTPGDRVFNLYSVRGLGNSSNILVRDAVSFYIDDVPFDNVHQFFPSELFDLEQVEILRGPQSTLYGRNSQAGVVNITSRPPSEDPELRARVLLGEFEERQAQLSVSTSLIPDTLGIRLAGFFRDHNGFTNNVLLGDGADEQSGLAGRANLVWTPSDRWNVSLNIAASDTNDDASVYVPIDQDDPFEVSRSDNGEFELDVHTQSLRVGYEGDRLRFTSITSHSDTFYNFTSFNDDFGSITLSDYDQEIFNQELRLQSPTDADSLQWIVGAYFQNRDFRIGDDLEVPIFLGTEVGESTYDQTTYAGFAQVDYQPLDALTLTAGLRYEYWQEELNRDAQVFETFDGAIEPALFFPATEIRDSDIDGDVWLPKFAASYRFNPNVMAYGSINRGYRPGTHNYLALSNDELLVDSENSWSYEIGLKTSWLDNRLGINLAGFYTDINNAQVLVLDDSLLFADIFNAEARAVGAELEIRATPFEGFDIIGGFGYTDAEFTDNANPFTGENFDGNRLLYAPDYTYNLAAQYRSPGGFFGRIELQGVGTVFFDDANTLKEDPFAIVNARIGYEFDQAGLYLFYNNLFDTEYVSLAFPDGLGGTLAGYGDRRAFGGEVRLQF
ncbi:MAG: TonB-dependent receptor [Cyanobacteria bacterium P01_F01_bin.150]